MGVTCIIWTVSYSPANTPQSYTSLSNGIMYSALFFLSPTVCDVHTTWTCTVSPAHSLCSYMFVCMCVFVCSTEICQGPDPAGHGVWPSEPAGEGLLWPDFPGHGQLQGQTDRNTNTCTHTLTRAHTPPILSLIRNYPESAAVKSKMYFQLWLMSDHTHSHTHTHTYKCCVCVHWVFIRFIYYSMNIY